MSLPNKQSCPKVKEVRLDKIQFLANPVGSGKTQAAIRGIELNDQESHIFVSPTTKLSDEIAKRMRADLMGNQIAQHIVQINGSTVASGKTVMTSVLENIRTMPTDLPHILLITTETFRNILPRLSNNDKARYNVYLDEGIDVLRTAQALTGKLTGELQTMLVLDEVTGEMSVKPEWLATVKSIALNDDAGLGRMAGLLHSKFIDVAGVLTCGLYDVFGRFGEQSTRVVGLLKPSLFRGFKSVTMILAEFEQSPLAHYWRHAMGVEFEPYPHNCDLFDTHKEKGPSISIYHVLDRRDDASGSVLKETVAGRSIGQHVCDAVENFFAERGEAYCYAVNRNVDACMPHGEQMPVKCAGLDLWKDKSNVAALSSSLPTPWVKDIVIKLLGVNGSEFYEMWRMADTYQTIGRCSLRDRNSKEPITIVVLSEAEALAIHQLFKGSKFMGKLGDVPCAAAARRAKENKHFYTPADNKAYFKYKTRSLSGGSEPLPKTVWFEQVRTPRLLAQLQQ